MTHEAPNTLLKHRPEFDLTIDDSNLNFKCELWCILYYFYEEKWTRNIEIALYISMMQSLISFTRQSSYMTHTYIYIVEKVNNNSNHRRMCVLGTLCGNVDKQSPFYIYMINMHQELIGMTSCMFNRSFVQLGMIQCGRSMYTTDEFVFIYIKWSAGKIQLIQYMRARFLSCSSWRYQMETFSALLALCAGDSPVTGEFQSQRPVTRSFDIFCDLRLQQTVE